MQGILYKAVRANFRTGKTAEALEIPYIDFDDRLAKTQSQWTIREALIFSFYWGFPTQSAEHFIPLKLDCHITELLSNPDVSMFEKQTEAKQFLGSSYFIMN